MIQHTDYTWMSGFGMISCCVRRNRGLWNRGTWGLGRGEDKVRDIFGGRISQIRAVGEWRGSKLSREYLYQFSLISG